MSEKVNILGVKIDKFTVEQAADKIIEYVESGSGTHYVFTPNSEMIMNAYRTETLRGVLGSADFLIADGIGVVYASKILKNPISQRCAGYDVACRLLEKMDEKGLSLYLFGSKQDTVEKARENINKKHPGINICGIHNGYFDDDSEIIEDINAKSPDVVFVCLGVPKQEYWIYNNRRNISARVMMGLGGSLDVFAGTVKRAPVFFQKLGIEWLYRLCKEPKRFMRMMDLPRFAFTVIARGKKYKQ